MLTIGVDMRRGTKMDSRKEAIRSIQYWWEEWQDIESWVGWEENKENFSKIAFALGQVQTWRDMVDKAVKKLENPDEN